MWSKGHDITGNAPGSVCFTATSGNPSSFNFTAAKGEALVDSPFLFETFPMMQNPQTVADWTLADFSGMAATQIGPGVLSFG